MPRCLWTDAVASARADQRRDAFSAWITTAGQKRRVIGHRQPRARLAFYKKIFLLH